MRCTILLGHSGGKRNLALPPWHLPAIPAHTRIAGFRGKNQLRLPRPDQVDVYLGQKLRIEQRAVPGAA